MCIRCSVLMQVAFKKALNRNCIDLVIRCCIRFTVNLSLKQKGQHRFWAKLTFAFKKSLELEVLKG